MNNKNIFLNIIGSLLCFIMFCVGMLYAEQVPLLILVGIVGLSGFSYFVYRIVTVTIANHK
ncbi:hypothetical protein [Psychrobacillus lasiicapitis]|uniref:Uncharacterized protein n=1 Tax=Psychrobacillus lasiicapitis TaxID=1636719 RepID=A0A544TI23_9BACI|nr:hypothetical protein [Psychrobacillus lasiicapitis]TQR17102.1 hypothetical protein FG382_02860 [Psychrobacillus lasiicapitis]GGA24499.1 hypothetical protein GCM10011384_12060 [Psychrobacillus lasiicapitis]